jgi:quercetin dioxygenase-like cupin family protein
MTEHLKQAPPVIDTASLPWSDHPRFSGILMKPLYKAGEGVGPGVSRVNVPPGGVIGWHNHTNQVETVYVLSGSSILTLDDREVAFAAGQIVAIPAQFDHTLCNTGEEVVELLCIFTPA